MIKSFKHKGLEKFAKTGCTSGIDPQHQKTINQQLTVLNAVTCIGDLRGTPKSWSLHELKGKFVGTWSLTVKENWRITFKFEDNDIVLVNYEDYH